MSSIGKKISWDVFFGPYLQWLNIGYGNGLVPAVIIA